MKAREATKLGNQIAELVHTEEIAGAYDLLAPVLAERTPFPMLGRIGIPIGDGPLETANRFLDHVAAQQTEGGWVVIGKALGQQLDRDLVGVFARCREYIIAGDVWYCADILGDRVPGLALVTHFDPALETLTGWRKDDNRWIRRVTGIATHVWGKRTKGAAEFESQARALLDLLAPQFDEWEMDAVKGIAWGLKTIGQYYPDLLVNWFENEILPTKPKFRTVMLKKTIAYLPEADQARITSALT